MPRIELRGVAKRYGPITAVERSSLAVADGEYVAILGPSGCGKTTLIKVLAGLTDPSEGQVLVDGRDVTAVPVEERDLGFVFQNIVLFPHMDVWRNATYGPWVHAKLDREVERAGEDVLRLVGMLEDRGMFPGELSTGSQQKASLARALANRARVLLLDEPLSALDARVRLDLRYALRSVVKDLGLTAIHVTHDQEEALSVADRVVVMRKGRIIEVGRPEELYTRPEHLFTANFVGESNFLEGAVLRLRGAWAVVELRNGYTLRVPSAGLTEGAAVVLAARAEWLTLAEEAFGNVIPGKVENRRFLGPTQRLRVRLATFDVILVDIPASQRINRVPDVLVSFPEASVLVYPRPYEGLQEALRLE